MINIDPNRELLRCMCDPTVPIFIKTVIVVFMDRHPEYLYKELREEIEINGEQYRPKLYESED